MIKHSYIKHIPVISCLCSLVLMSGCSMDGLDIDDGISGSEGKKLTASAQVTETPGTKGYWHYMEGGSLPFHWTGNEKLSTAIYSSNEGWYELKRNCRSIKVGVVRNPDNPGRAEMSGTIISNQEIQSGDFIYFTNGTVASDEPSSVTFALPDRFTQIASNEDGLSDYMYIYGESSIVSADAATVNAGEVLYRHVPSTFRFDISNTSGKNLRIRTLKISVTDENGTVKEVFPESCVMTVNPDGEEHFIVGEDTEAGKYGEILLDMKTSEDAQYHVLNNGSSIRASVLAFPAELDGVKMTVSALYHGTDEFVELKTVSVNGLKMQSGKVYVMDIEILRPSADPDNIIDLSAKGTANTYVVNRPMQFYSFKATVKGNGVARDFYTEVPEQTLTIEPKSVLLLWYNSLQTSAEWVDLCPIVIESLEISDGNIRFETPEDFVDGNLVIAAFAEEGVTYDSITVDENGLINNATILWSWNIWAVKDYDPETCGVTVGSYVMMDRNLGALRNELPDDNKEFMAPATIGNYYQWGRKDPFPPNADSRNYFPSYFSHLPTTPTYTPIKALQYTNTDSAGKVLEKQIFSNEGTGGNCESSKTCYKIAVESYEASVALVVNQPHKFITNGDVFPEWAPYNKDSYSTFALWGDPEYGDEDDIQKTIYDPCPAGWRLFTNQTFMELIKVSGTVQPYKVSEFGVNLAGSYFPINGVGRDGRNFGLGWIKQPSASVNFMGWSATSDCMDYYGMHQRYFNWTLETNQTFILSETTTQTPNSGTSVGRTVRCVKE